MAESPERTALLRCEAYRRSFPMADLVLPADTLVGNSLIAKWVRDKGLCVGVHTGEGLALAFAASIHPARLIVYTNTMTESDLRATVNLHPGRVVVSSADHVEVLAAAIEHGPQRVVVQVTGVDPAVSAGFRCDTVEFDAAIEAILSERRLALLGMYCDLGSGERGFAGVSAAITDMIIEMARISRHHGLVLTRLGLGGSCLVPSGDWAVELPRLAYQIDESLDEACARLRFPRPRADISPTAMP